MESDPIEAVEALVSKLAAIDDPLITASYAISGSDLRALRAALPALREIQRERDEYEEHAEAAANAYQEAGRWLMRLPEQREGTSSGREPEVSVTESELVRVLDGLSGLKDRADEIGALRARLAKAEAELGKAERAREWAEGISDEAVRRAEAAETACSERVVRALEGASKKIREKCKACDNGVYGVGNDGAVECQYCGDPMLVIRALIEEEKR